MVRVTAFLRASVLTAALAATTLTATLLVSQAASRTASAATSTHSQSTHGAGGKPGPGVAPGGTAPGAAPPASTAPQPTTPAAGCLKPGAPMCMDDASTFVSADRMSACQGEVKEYVDKSMTYLTCLNDENVATGRELSGNVERFNCRLSGRKGCN
ncbi:hypothetical protein [Azospirillum sp. TSO35-2]|uniref:hypothetical protein n=1 Tax=Azospirillum sp. TSO35-2 TaxID=716796 RepID=UPI000D61BBD5|nr:hypothetical protein [Azospirillum sp. TSO35-2]PWC33075.1 hypothetical protein TSO352_21255 [Azospirillum sp. TSO35-2]